MHGLLGLDTLRHEDRTDADFGKYAIRERADIGVVVQDAVIDDSKVLAEVPPEELALMRLVPCHVRLERLQIVLRRGLHGTRKRVRHERGESQTLARRAGFELADEILREPSEVQGRVAKRASHSITSVSMLTEPAICTRDFGSNHHRDTHHVHARDAQSGGALKYQRHLIALDVLIQ